MLGKNRKKFYGNIVLLKVKNHNNGVDNKLQTQREHQDYQQYHNNLDVPSGFVL